MKTYTLTMRVEADDEITSEQIREELYDAAEDIRSTSTPSPSPSRFPSMSTTRAGRAPTTRPWTSSSPSTAASFPRASPARSPTPF